MVKDTETKRKATGKKLSVEEKSLRKTFREQQKRFEVQVRHLK